MMYYMIEQVVSALSGSKKLILEVGCDGGLVECIMEVLLLCIIERT